MSLDDCAARFSAKSRLVVQEREDSAYGLPACEVEQMPASLHSNFAHPAVYLPCIVDSVCHRQLLARKTAAPEYLRSINHITQMLGHICSPQS